MKEKFTKEEVRELVLNKFAKYTSQIINMDDIIFNIGIDSLDLVQLVAEVEENYKVEISDTELVKIQKVKDIVNLLFSKVEHK